MNIAWLLNDDIEILLVCIYDQSHKLFAVQGETSMECRKE